MKKQPKRIYIVGSSGSGKTTLAKHLIQKLKYPHCDLDDIRFPPKINKVVPLKQRLPKVTQLARKETWIAEGIYITWTKLLLQRADQIIWLDIPLHTTLTRITRRYIKNMLIRKDRYGFKSFLLLARFLINYHHPSPNFGKNLDPDYSITRISTEKALNPYRQKVIQLTHSKIEKILTL